MGEAADDRRDRRGGLGQPRLRRPEGSLISDRRWASRPGSARTRMILTPKDIDDARRTGARPRPSRPSRAADAEAGGEPALLRRRARHDGERPAGRLRLSARLGRLRAPLAQADGFEEAGHGPHGVPRAQPAGAGAPGRGAERIRLRYRLDGGRSRPRPRLPVPRSRRARYRALLRDRVVSGAAGAEAGPEEPGAALPGARRQCPPARPPELPRRGYPREPHLLRDLSRMPPHRADRPQ